MNELVENATQEVATPEVLPEASGSLMVEELSQQWEVAGKIASAMGKAGMIPSSYQKSGEPIESTKARICIGILKGFEIGLQPITALSTIAVINNRPCLWGDGAKALIQRSGKLEWLKEELIGDGEDMKAVVTMKRVGQEQPYVGEFSVDDAKKARLWNNTSKQPWMMYPKRMLKWRAFSFAARDGFADVLSGLSVAEEVNDMKEDTAQTNIDDMLSIGVDAPKEDRTEERHD